MYIRRADGGPKYNDSHEVCHDFLDPSPASGRGLEVESGKIDTTRMTIAVLTGTSWVLSKSLGTSEPSEK